MRIWTLHPQYLDRQGLLALWREALLAQKVLLGRTRGYRHHPQLERFRHHRNPVAAMATYLAEIRREALRRGYKFDRRRIFRRRSRTRLPETRGQLLYEWDHLKRKLAARDPARLRSLSGIGSPRAHPLFRIIPGEIRAWEKRPRPPSAPRARPPTRQAP